MKWTVAIGVDTHKYAHTAVALDRLGRELERRELPARAEGYAQLWLWARGLGEPVFAIEGSGCYGAGLARFLEAAGAPVFECERPSRRERRRGKSDPLDAEAAARKLLAGGRGLARRRGGGRREALRVLLVERASADSARTDALNQLHALVVTAPDELRERLGSLGENTLAHAAAALRPRPAASEQTRILVDVLRRLGGRVVTLSEQLRANERELAQLIRAIDPELLAETGVGPVCAAQLVVSTGTPGRMRSEASFAALAGVSPLDASSGLQQRHRLNRGGDRQLNRALHVIAVSRKQHHLETAAYYARLRARGKTKREALRCVKRTLARYFYRRLSALPEEVFA
jgi:transposase